MYGVNIESFSGMAALLPASSRTPADILAALGECPFVSTFDMSELPWLRQGIESLLRNRKIVERPVDYPWHYYEAVKPDGGEG